MAKSTRPERPKSRLPDGRVNPAYTAWRKANIAREDVAVLTADEAMNLPAEIPAPQPAPLTLRVVKLPQNDRFVICEHPTEKGKTVSVRLWKRGIGQKLLKKSLRAEIRDGAFHQLR